MEVLIKDYIGIKLRSSRSFECLVGSQEGRKEDPFYMNIRNPIRPTAYRITNIDPETLARRLVTRFRSSGRRDPCNFKRHLGLEFRV